MTLSPTALPCTIMSSAHALHALLEETMPRQAGPLRFLIVVAAFSRRALRRLFRRWASPGSGPFVAGC